MKYIDDYLKVLICLLIPVNLNISLLIVLIWLFNQCFSNL